MSKRMATERRQIADDFVPCAPYADTPSNPDESTPMSPQSTPPISRPNRHKAFPRADRMAGLVSATAIAAVITFLFSGCSTPVVQVTVDLPTRFAAADNAAEIEPEAAWWESFHDPVLTDLVRRAAVENRDVRIAAERLRAARSGVTVSRSFLAPSVSAAGTAGDRSSGYGNAVKQLLPDTQSGSAGLDVSWELDLSGRLRAGASAAASDALAAENAVRGVQLMVMGDVASNYFTLIGALRQLDTLRQISAAHDETLRLVKARQHAGLATMFDVERSQTEADSARAQIPPLETVAAVSRHRIAVLVGDQAVNAARIDAWRGDVAVPDIQPGQPATLLQRRPDVLALMAQLDAANARRQQAAAEWFPRLFLNASFGRQNVELNGIGLGSARYTNVAGMLAMPIFNAGRTSAINEIAESGQREAVLRAEDGIVRALEDVENALVVLSSERQRSQSLRAAATSAEAAIGRAQSLYDRGQIDLLPLLDAQRSRLAVRLAANDSGTRLLLDSVQLYKALGGGWQVFEPVAEPAAPPTTRSAFLAPRS
jgi:NodT family efflux transporter outer membrane factor (OMF) lipoprotein